MTTVRPLPSDVDLPVPLPRLVLVEMRKMLDTRAGFWLLAIIVLLTAVATVLTAVFGSDEGTQMEILLLAASAPQGLLLPVLGVLLVTSEWGQRAAMTTFTLVPRRERVVVAKIIAALGIGLAVLLVTFAIAALAAALSGADVGDVESETLGHFTLLQVLGIVQGLAFGLLLLNSAAAIVSFFLLPIITSIVFSVAEPLSDLRDWVDLGFAQAPLSEPGSLTGDEWAHVASTSVIWILLPMALGCWRMLTAEVK
jgi:ABC-type transport system involved in multi-copper enzyme maturation permease subunit